MNTINIIIAIDALGAVAKGSLKNNVYLVDNNKYLGSWNEGSNLFTVCQNGQLVNWTITSINPNSNANITAFSGDLVNKKVCTPQQEGLSGEYYWSGRIENKGSVGQFVYTVNISIDGKSMRFPAYIKIV